jgi:hypothetical protein
VWKVAFIPSIAFGRDRRIQQISNNHGWMIVDAGHLERSVGYNLPNALRLAHLGRDIRWTDPRHPRKQTSLGYGDTALGKKKMLPLPSASSAESFAELKPQVVLMSVY